MRTADVVNTIFHTDRKGKKRNFNFDVIIVSHTIR